MNNPFNPFENNMFNPEATKKVLDEFKRQSDRSLQHKFGGQIKGNFLISIKDRIMRLLGMEIPNCYDLQITEEKLLDHSIEQVDYDICRHIVGIHRSNLIFETIEKRKQLESNSDYQEQLINKAIAQIKLRRYGSIHFRQHPIMRGESFIFFPVPYYLFVLSMRMIELLYSDKARNELPCYGSFSIIANKGLAALSLLEDNFLDNAYPICRGIIETYVKLVVLMNKPEAISRYNKFSKYELDKSCISQTYPTEFTNEYTARVNQGSKDKIDYLHYGWVDSIKDYHSIVRSKPYSINGLIEYLHFLYGEEGETFLNNLERLFKMCHGYTHGSIGFSRYPLLHYHEISMMLYGTISHTYKIMCESLKQSEMLNGIDIIKEVEDAYIKLEQQYDNRSTENFEYYYKNQFKI